MNTPEFVAALMKPDAYPHPCERVRLVETHISWVFLTGEFAYKVKKPVHFNFVDFSSAALRRHFCEEELRCNRAFAPELYLGLVTINRERSGLYRVDGDGEVVDTAVWMRQFPQSHQLDNLLAAGALEAEIMSRFGDDLAGRHADLPQLVGSPEEVPQRVLEPVLDNFRTLAPLAAARPHAPVLTRLEEKSRDAFEALLRLFQGRLADGFVRECHGDLHLSNLVLMDGGVRAFDCLEFNPKLRWIDTMSDVAFLLMDCSVRGRDDLGYAFLDGYLTRSADYAGVTLLAYYQAYRSMVRAKVAALQLESGEADNDAVLKARMLDHIRWADDRLNRSPGMLVLMCGLSGSGKSFVAERLAPRLPAVRVRSDVLRKALAGLQPHDRSHSPVDGGLYTSRRNRSVYESMLQLCREALRMGENVIADATFLERDQRVQFQHAAARCGARCVVAYCTATPATLDERVRQRQASGTDVSEAGVEVLALQRSRFEDIGSNEPTLEIDTDQPIDIDEFVVQLRAQSR